MSVDALDGVAGVTGGVSSPGRPRPVTPLGLVAARLRDVAEVLDARPERDPDRPLTDATSAARRDACADPRVRAWVGEALEIAAGLDAYLEANAGPESPALRALAEHTAAHDWTTHAATSAGGGPSTGPADSPADSPAAAPLEQEMLSGHAEGRFLHVLARAVRARSVLEVGMFTGYSALALAEALPPGGRVVACEIDAQVAAIAQGLFAASPAGERIVVHVGPAEQTLARLAAAGECFDLVFLDADKAGYAGYLRLLLDRGLLAPGGLICADNTLMQGQPWTSATRTANGEAIAEFNRLVAADPDLEQVLVPLRDGLTLIRRTSD